MRRARNPGELCKWGFADNKEVLSRLEKTIAKELTVFNAFSWAKAVEGPKYWADFNRNPHEEGWNRLRSMVEELALPLGPINKEEWL